MLLHTSCTHYLGLRALGYKRTPWASNLEPEGLRPATQAADPWEMGEDEPMATDAPAPWDRAEASSSSQQPPPRHQPEVEPVRDMWEEVPTPPGAQQHTFVFHKPDNTMCRSVLLSEERNISSYPHSIDETPRFVDNPSSGTAPIEHYIRRLVTYLARLQSVYSEQRERAQPQGVCQAGYKAMVANVFSDSSCL